MITFPLLDASLLGSGCVFCGAPREQEGRWQVLLVPLGEGRARRRVEINVCPRCVQNLEDPVAEFRRRQRHEGHAR